MHRGLYRKMNLALYVLIAMVFAVLQTTIFSYFPFNYLHPDIAFIIAVYFGYRRGLIEGGIVVAFTAIVLRAHSGADQHFFMIVYMYTFLLAKLLRKIFATRSILTSSIGMGSLLYFFKQVAVFSLFWFDGKQDNALMHTLIHLIPGLLTQMALTPVFFALFHRLDLLTWADEHAEDEYDLNREF